jgi:hypothetical protein
MQYIMIMTGGSEFTKPYDSNGPGQFDGHLEFFFSAKSFSLCRVTKISSDIL